MNSYPAAPEHSPTRADKYIPSRVEVPQESPWGVDEATERGGGNSVPSTAYFEGLMDWVTSTLGVSANRLADILGVQHNKISRWKRQDAGGRRPSWRNSVKLMHLVRLKLSMPENPKGQATNRFDELHYFTDGFQWSTYWKHMDRRR